MKRNIKGLKKYFVLFFVFLFILGSLSAQSKTIYLWKDVKNMKSQYSKLFVHEPVDDGRDLRPGVIICPGGSYHHLGLYNEGNTTAKWFTQQGFVAFVLKYRTSEENYHHPAMLEDIQRAIQLLRENAQEYRLDSSKLGLIGYSAGGHLVTMAGEFHSSHKELDKLGIEYKVSLRPDFIIPVYPVVSMQDSVAHKFSRKSLLGLDQSQHRKDEFSMELNVPEDMPPTYIVVALDDNVVDPKNSMLLYESLKEKNISNCHLEIYQWGKHGFGMTNGKFMKAFNWNNALLSWLQEIDMI